MTEPGKLACTAVLELPGVGATWVECELTAGHGGKHSGVLRGKRYRWSALYARVASYVRGSGR